MTPPIQDEASPAHSGGVPLQEGAPLKKAKAANGPRLVAIRTYDTSELQEAQKDIEGAFEGEDISRNRMSSGRHGERIPCPMDPSHCIYALRLQAHLKKCTKARDKAFSHCLPFMQPGTNLPQQQPKQQEHQHEQQQDQQQHARYVESPGTAAALTPQLEAKVTKAYRQSLLYLSASTTSPAAAEATHADTPVKFPWEIMKQLPAATFIEKCCSGSHRGERERTGKESVLLLRAAADACKVQLGNGAAVAKGHPLGSLEAQIENTLQLLPQQDKQHQLQQLLQQLQDKLNKHQQQLLQLLAVCLCERYLTPDACDETLVVELGAGKGDLTRWLCCWSAAVVAAAAAAAAQKYPPQSVLVAPKHRGIRCVVVDREARRYCKESKDKTYRNPNSTRSVHPAATIAAAVERTNTVSVAAATTAHSSISSNPLLAGEEEGRENALTHDGEQRELTPLATATAADAATAAATAVSSSREEDSDANIALPFPPVRLRMDITDFSLVALMEYIAGKGPLRKPHIPAFFSTLFRYGCRFRAPGETVKEAEKETSKETEHGALKEPEGGDTAKEAKANGQAKGITEDSKPRFLCSVEDGCVDDFFRLAQTLGEGGGRNMQKIDGTFAEHFKGMHASQVIGVAKHLCGGGSDVALRCFASAKDTQGSDCRFCICIATCCHHRCTVDSFVGTEFLLSVGFALTEIPLLFSLSGWGTGATGKKRVIGSMVKRILDISRVWWLRQKGFATATIRQFVEAAETPECFVITASSNSGFTWE